MSGYAFCDCRDCFDITIGEANTLCPACADAGCVREVDAWDRSAWHRECQRDDAYGVEEYEEV